MGTLQGVQSALSHCAMKPHGRDTWRGNSPFRSGSDSESFVLSATDDEHGTFFDHVENAGGSLYQLAERLGVALPERAPATVTKKAYTGGLAEYAEAHGAPVEAYERAMWTQGVWYDHDHKADRPALIYPTAGGERVRFIDGLKPPFKHKAGYVPCWYGLKNAVPTAQDAGLPLVLCNGEPSVVSAQWWGIPAACITSSGERELKGKLLAELKEVWGTRRVIIALDCDDNGRKASEKLAKSLQDEGFSTAIVDLGLTDAGDLADFCKLWGMDALSSVIERARFVVPTTEQRQLDAVSAIGANIQRLTLALKQARLSDKPIQTMITDLQAQLDAAKLGTPGNIVTGGGAVADMLAIRFEKYRENRGRFIGLPTFIDKIDTMTRGLRHGLAVFLGAAGSGKSTLLASFTGNLIKSGYRGLILPTEMNKEDWSMRVLAYLMGVTTTDIEEGKLGADYNAKLETALSRIEANLDYMERGVSTVGMLEAAINQKREGKDYDFVVVDSINDIIGASENLSMAYGTGLTDLSALAMDMRLPFICSAHVSREVNKREDKRPLPYDAFGGMSVEKTAAAFFSLYRHEYYLKKDMVKADDRYPNGTVELACHKFRERGDIEGERVTLRFIGGCGMYSL